MAVLDFRLDLKVKLHKNKNVQKSETTLKIWNFFLHLKYLIPKILHNF